MEVGRQRGGSPDTESFLKELILKEMVTSSRKFFFDFFTPFYYF